MRRNRDRSIGAPAWGLTVVAGAVALLVAACGGSSPGTPLAAPPAAALKTSRLSHITVIVMENKEAADVLGASSSRYLARLARRYGVATQSFAITHPSLPNYLALTSGSTHGITSDCSDCHVAARNLVDQLERAGISWKAYMEGLPSPCSGVTSANGYAKKHDPFLYYDDVAGVPRRCRKVVPFSRLATDLRRSALPSFAFISPNLCDDTHDCPVASGDHFLAGVVPRLLRESGPHGFVVVTWDEGSTSRGCCGGSHGGRIATVVAGPDVRRHARSRRPVDHYGVLRTVEDALALPHLGGAASAGSGSLHPLFAHQPHIR